MGKIYNYKSKINTYNSTPDYKMSPVMPLEVFQEAAQSQLETMDLGVEFLRKNHLAWILVKYEIDYHEYPKAGDSIIVETEPLGLNRFEANRRFAILSPEGKVLITGKSVWMMINTETGKLVRITDVKEMEKLLSPDDEIYKFGRLEKVGEYDHEETFKVRYFDIDINHHANNVKYLNWAIESLPVSVVREYDLEKVRIIYKAQAFYGETVVAKTKQVSPLTWRTDICKEDGQILCEIEMTARKREHTLTLRAHE